jgi:Putative auto-transporter adhesin, head GIN domain
MRKMIFTACLLIIAVMIANAQSDYYIKGNGDIATVTRSIGNFTGVKITGFYEVYLIPGDHPGTIKLEGESNLLFYVEPEVKKDELVINTKKGHELDFTRPMKIYITVGKLNSIALEGSGNIVSQGALHGDNMTVKLTGSGDMDIAADVRNDLQVDMFGSGNLKLDVHAKNCHGSHTGSGNMDIRGTASVADMAVTGSGNLNADKLTADNWQTNVTGSGNLMH